jgi:hypothetical protein
MLDDALVKQICLKNTRGEYIIAIYLRPANDNGKI